MLCRGLVRAASLDTMRQTSTRANAPSRTEDPSAAVTAVTRPGCQLSPVITAAYSQGMVPSELIFLPIMRR